MSEFGVCEIREGIVVFNKEGRFFITLVEDVIMCIKWDKSYSFEEGYKKERKNY